VRYETNVSTGIPLNVLEIWWIINISVQGGSSVGKRSVGKRKLISIFQVGKFWSKASANNYFSFYGRGQCWQKMAF